MSLPAARIVDEDYRELVTLLDGSPAASREGHRGVELATLVAFWPDDPEHARLGVLAERLVARFGGKFGPEATRVALRSGWHAANERRV